MKKYIIVVLSLIVIILLGIFIYFNNIQEKRIPIITYHNVLDKVTDKNSVDISTKYFEKQIKWLHDHHYKTLSMDEFYDWKVNNKKLPRKSVLITFDDGWKGIYDNAYSILKKYNMKASVFVVWSYANSNSDIYLNLKQINQIKKEYPNISFYSHSFNLHKESALQSKYDDYKNDMKIVNDKYIDKRYYAYPFGKSNPDYRKALEDSNYKLAFTFGPYDYATRKQDNLSISRIGVFESTQFWKFKLKLLILE